MRRAVTAKGVFTLGVLGFAGYLFHTFGVVGAGSILLLLGGLTAALVFRKPSRCGICSNLIKRRYYTWKLEGRRVHACPECNRTLERRQSRAALGS